MSLFERLALIVPRVPYLNFSVNRRIHCSYPSSSSGELDRVMRYPRVSRIHGLDAFEINEHIQAVELAASIIDLPPATASIVIGDPTDDFVVATAILGDADVICTLDRHIRQPLVIEYCKQFDVQVATDLELLNLLRSTRRASPYART